MLNFLSSYDSENEDDEGGQQKEVSSSKNEPAQKTLEDGSESDQSDLSPIDPNSILLRHHHSHHQKTTVTTTQIIKLSTEPEPLELLGESPEFEFRQNRDEEEEDEEVEQIAHQSPQISSGDGGGKRSMPSSSAPSSSRSHSSAAQEPPEKKPALAEEDESASKSRDNNEVLGGGQCDEEASSLARSMIGKLSDEILLPPEPTGQCPRHLQDRIIELLNYTKRSGLSFVEHAERSKSFRNPSIYEKLVQYCKIDENGTNFPPEIYNPYIWGKESFYEELGKVQRQEMERREKERRPGGQQSASSQPPVISSSMQLGNLEERERNRKSKWDTAAAHRPVVQVLTGTAKIIPATGTLGPGFGGAGAAANKHH